MRGREFLMKDGYSFDLDYAGAVVSYRKMMLAYMRTFQRLGVKAIPMVADTGPIGGNLSHEFIILAPTGESQVFYDAAFERMDFSGDSFPTRSEADLERFFTQMTTPYAATDEKHDEAAWETVGGEARGARHRGRPHLLLRHQIQRADGPDGRRARRRARSSRTWAATASASRGWSAR